MLACVERRLRDAPLGRRADDHDALGALRLEEQVERSVIEGGVAVLEQNVVAGPREEISDDVSAGPVRGFAGERGRVTVPAVAVVVDVDHRHSGLARYFDRARHRIAAGPKGSEQCLGVVVLEGVEHVDHEESVPLPEVDHDPTGIPRRPERCTRRSERACGCFSPLRVILASPQSSIVRSALWASAVMPEQDSFPAETDAIVLGRYAASLGAVLDVPRAVRNGAEITSVLGTIARAVSEALGFETVVMNVYRPEWDDFYVAAVHGSDAVRAALLGSVDDWGTWKPLLHPQFRQAGA